MLKAEMRLQLSRIDLDVAFTVETGEVVALLGPSGSGKSVTLRALAGLLPLTGGRVALGDTVLEEPARRLRVATEKRRIALMFQDYLLFPHLSALENVAFGLRCRGDGKKTAREKAAEALERMGLAEAAQARPGQMSGGQQQRVAMARALVTEPRLLLLDEPLSALDVSTKTDVRRLLREVLHRTRAATVLVTHDLLDAVAISDRMMVIENGTIVQAGTPADVTSRPRSRYVADLTGLNLLRGTAHGGFLELDRGTRLACAASAAGPALAVIAPADVAVTRQRPEGRGENTWRGKVSAVDLMGDRVRVRIDGTPTLTVEVPPAAVNQFKLDDGGDLWVSVEPTAITVYPQLPHKQLPQKQLPQKERTMAISARNQIPAQVTRINSGEAIGNVELDANGVRLVASITVEAVRELGLKEGDRVTAVVKASDVLVNVS